MDEAPADSIHPKSRKAWRTWLQKHHERDQGVWLISFKKVSGKASMGYDAAVEEALCFGWIDSKPQKLDEERTMLWFSPRKAGSGWSKPNKERIERAIAAGQMSAAGLAKIEAAKADGSWTLLDAVEALEMPQDLALALRLYPKAEEYFEGFPRSAKRGILEWISLAKTAPTRQKRILDTASKAAQNIRANQWVKP
jgi:uncharacterized protein YdeI (YjbR/CyaY-like superfamily)